jgi:hypothetical protein
VTGATEALERGDVKGAQAIVESPAPPRLTPKQARRAAAAIAGEPLSAIAKAEGVSKQSVAETLRAPAVRETIREIIGRATIQPPGGEKRSLVTYALQQLAELLHAERPVVHGGTYEMVPDNVVRLAAATKILELAEPPGSATPRPPTTVVDEVVESRTSTTVARRRSATV